MTIFDFYSCVVRAYSFPQLQSAPSASTDIEVQQLVADFSKLDVRGRHLALAQIACLARLMGGPA